jgi:hypothetical protein
MRKNGPVLSGTQWFCCTYFRALRAWLLLFSPFLLRPQDYGGQAGTKTLARVLLLLADRTANNLLRLLDDGGKMVGAIKAFGVELIDLFRARGASSEPATR